MPLRPPDTASDPARIQSATAVRGFRWVEQALLVQIAGLTIIAAAMEVWSIYLDRQVGLADILLMFLYLEVIGMIAVFYTGISSPFV